MMRITWKNTSWNKKYLFRMSYQGKPLGLPSPPTCVNICTTPCFMLLQIHNCDALRHFLPIWRIYDGVEAECLCHSFIFCILVDLQTIHNAHPNQYMYRMFSLTGPESLGSNLKVNLHWRRDAKNGGLSEPVCANFLLPCADSWSKRHFTQI